MHTTNPGPPLRHRTLPRLPVGLLALLALAAAAIGCGQSDITKARIERAVAPHFARQYAAQAVILGHPGVTPASTHVVLACDRGGP